jgi:hypothetical protein
MERDAVRLVQERLGNKEIAANFYVAMPRANSSPSPNSASPSAFSWCMSLRDSGSELLTCSYRPTCTVARAPSEARQRTQDLGKCHDKEDGNEFWFWPESATIWCWRR